MLKKQRYLHIILTLTSLTLISCSLFSNNNKSPEKTPPVVVEKPVNVTLTPAKNWQKNNHIHGIGVHPTNPLIIYVGTHEGLLTYNEKKQWFLVGKSQDDYMGFTTHPTDNTKFYSSGHTPKGGNLGFQMTTNGGESWQQISMPNQDFHALAIAPSNPKIMYGFITSGNPRIMKSEDEGKNWQSTQMTGLIDAPFNLVVNPTNPNHIYATTRYGIYESQNSGDDWLLLGDTQKTQVLGLAASQERDKIVLYGYRFDQSLPGIYRSYNQAQSWEKLGDIPGGVLFMAIAPSNPRIIYAVTNKNLVFQSQNFGTSWQELKNN